MGWAFLTWPVSNHLTTQNTLATALTDMLNNHFEHIRNINITSVHVEVVMKIYTTQNVGTSQIKRVNGLS